MEIYNIVPLEKRNKRSCPEYHNKYKRDTFVKVENDNYTLRYKAFTHCLEITAKNNNDNIKLSDEITTTITNYLSLLHSNKNKLRVTHNKIKEQFTYNSFYYTNKQLLIQLNYVVVDAHSIEIADKYNYTIIHKKKGITYVYHNNKLHIKKPDVWDKFITTTINIKEDDFMNYIV